MHKIVSDYGFPRKVRLLLARVGRASWRRCYLEGKEGGPFRYIIPIDLYHNSKRIYKYPHFTYREMEARRKKKVY